MKPPVLSLSESSERIDEALFDNFHNHKLRKAFEDGAIVNNNFNGKSTFYMAINQVSSEAGSSKYSSENVVGFFKILFDHGLDCPRNGVEMAVLAKAPAFVVQMTEDRLESHVLNLKELGKVHKNPLLLKPKKLTMSGGKKAKIKKRKRVLKLELEPVGV